ncbi:MAG: FAD-dependent thymidylate synthase [Calditrichaeota bacterium]|nr:FAD-dependent thymidylate synthase [Calditrichota bacterium]
MRVTLAGFNVDTGYFEAVQKILREVVDPDLSPIDRREILMRFEQEPVTPETISAAYARISRSEKSVRDLRIDARASVARARQSNERIVFGLGHASVAEHAVFNIDITDASRLALEDLEAHRLTSFTEASQRYISMKGEYVLAQELESSELRDECRAHFESLFENYRELSDELTSFHHDLPEKERVGRAREDARYLLPLACPGQVGMTVNARTAEVMIRRFAGSSLSEVREMGRQMHHELRRLVPSLIKYTEPNPKRAEAEDDLTQAAHNLMNGTEMHRGVSARQEVQLLASPNEQELQVVSALLFRAGGRSFEEARSCARAMGGRERQRLLATAHRYINEHDEVLREMELAVFQFEVVLSASAFAQLKRHRMATIVRQPYDPALGVTIPPAIEEAGLAVRFLAALEPGEVLFKKIGDVLPKEASVAASYVLSNAHHRRVIFQANARELTHLSRLRMDAHAQWDIRRLAGQMIELARDAAPVLMMFAAGKDSFAAVNKRIGEFL